MGRWALQYARLGWQVLPVHWPMGNGCSCKRPDCTNPGKHPLTLHGVHDATTDRRQIRKWWRTWPEANIGVATGAASGIFVVDADGAVGRETLVQLCGNPRTLMSRTGNGRHYFFRYPGERIRNSVRFAPGLDVRGDGGYVIAPPSRHQNGKRYRWI